MLLLYYTSTVLLSLSFKANNDRLLKSMDTYDRTHLPSYVCIAGCMQRKHHYSGVIATVANAQQSNNTGLHECVDDCDIKNTIQATNYTMIRKMQENYHLNLICRDDNTLNFRINVYELNETEMNANELIAQDGEYLRTFTIYVIKLHVYNNAEKYLIFVSDMNFFTFDKLLPNTVYNITTMAVHSDNKYSIIAKQQQFRTLRRGYIPNNITDIKVINFTLHDVNGMHLKAAITWKPDMTCFYDIICFSPENENYDLQPWEIRNPLPPQNLTVEQINVAYNTCALNVSWLLPQHLPDNYTLAVYDLSSEKLLRTINLSKETNNFYISNITITGILYEVSVTAFTLGGRATATFTDFTKTMAHIPGDHSRKRNSMKQLTLLIALIFCLAILTISAFVLYQRRSKLKHYRQRCEYLEKMRKVPGITSNSNGNNRQNNPQATIAFDLQYQLEQESKLQNDDELQIAVNNLRLFEILGEGAFGVVRRGLYKDENSGTQREVAVKMLKSSFKLKKIVFKTFYYYLVIWILAHPGIDDVRALLQEIEVMRSVGKHPNIVSIIGYSIRHYTEMMLLTEYCSFGSLLSFLRAEWRYLNEKKQKPQELGGYKLMMRQFEMNLPGIPEIEEDYDLISRIKNNITTNYKTETFQLKTKEEQDIVTSKEITSVSTTYGNTTYSNQDAITNRPQTEDNLEKPKTTTSTICTINGGRQGQFSLCSKLEKKSNLSLIQEKQKTFKKTIRFQGMAVDNKAYFDISSKQTDQQTPKKYYFDTVTRRPLSPIDLLKIAQQIAVGMEFLAKHKVVHLGNGKLPIKWLALESLTHQVYTTESDVWSYGILLYEIVTLGSAPYPSITTNRLLNFLKAGHRMEKPNNCSQEIYDLMHSCWHEIPSQRPTFGEIIKTLNKLKYHSNTIDDIKLKMKCCPPRSPIIANDIRYLKPL
uniref:Protein kinase domain-containing protein n=1 Tax=Glossina brevipalpis TaxID=37001 RepID=A0A1A9WI57_9MUSC